MTSPTGLYLKNARVSKDGDGSYWLYIESGDLSALFLLSSGEEADEESISRQALAAWLADQDKSNGQG